MPEESEASSPPRRRWLLDDVVVISFTATCLILAYILRTASTAYEPTFISVFLGISVAAITYRYLGGTQSSEFRLAALKLGGSAALLLAVTWFVGLAMIKERGLISTDAAFREIQKSKDGEIHRLNKLANDANHETETLRETIAGDDQVLAERIARLEPDDPLVEDLRRALRNPIGPGREIARTQKLNIMNSGAVSGAMAYWICADKFSQRYPNSALAIKLLRVSTSPELTQDISSAGTIDSDTCSKPNREYDVALSCDASAKLFPDLVFACNGSRPQFTSDRRIGEATVGVPVTGN